LPLQLSLSLLTQCQPIRKPTPPRPAGAAGPGPWERAAVWAGCGWQGGEHWGGGHGDGAQGWCFEGAFEGVGGWVGGWVWWLAGCGGRL